MGRQSQNLPYRDQPLGGIYSAWFTRAKVFWGGGLILQALASLIGALSVFTKSTSVGGVLVVSAFAFLGAVATWYSESVRAKADQLLRHIEFENGFGWRVDTKLLSDSLADSIDIRQEAQDRGVEQGPPFSSRKSLGPQRAIENLRESAWWTQQLSRRLSWIVGLGALGLTTITSWSLLVAVSLVGSTTPLAVTAIVMAVVSMAFTGSVLRLPIEYFTLSSRAAGYDEKASQLLRGSSLGEVEALRVLSDYQLMRFAAPPIPDWVWRQRRAALSRIWLDIRRDVVE